MKKKTKSTNSGSTNYTMHDYFELKRMQEKEFDQKLNALNDKYDYTISDLQSKLSVKFQPYKQFSSWCIVFAVYFVAILCIFGGYDLVFAAVNLGLTVVTIVVLSLLGKPCTKMYHDFIDKQLTKKVGAKNKALKDFLTMQENVRKSAINVHIKPVVEKLKTNRYADAKYSGYIDNVVQALRSTIENEIQHLDNRKHVEYLLLDFKFMIQNNGIYFKEQNYRREYDYDFDIERIPYLADEFEQMAFADYVTSILLFELRNRHKEATFCSDHEIQENFSCGIITISYSEKNKNYVPINWP